MPRLLVYVLLQREIRPLFSESVTFHCNRAKRMTAAVKLKMHQNYKYLFFILILGLYALGWCTKYVPTKSDLPDFLYNSYLYFIHIYSHRVLHAGYSFCDLDKSI